jgi:parallel beta-helix repeat protein
VLDWLTAGQPDGTTDNTTQLQAAITAGVGKVVYFPKTASPYMTHGLLALSNSHLVIDGTIMGTPGANGSAFVSVISTDGSTSHSNIVIEGCGIIDGNVANTTVHGFTAINPQVVTNGIIRGLTCQNTQRSGISVDSCNGFVVEDCYMTGNTNSNQIVGNFSLSVATAKNCWFRNCRIDTVADFGFAFYQGTSFCGIENCNISNTTGGNAGITVTVDGGSTSSDHVAINGNIVSGASDSGIKVTNSISGTHTDIVITGNLIYNNTGTGVVLQACKRVNVTGNIISASNGGIAASSGAANLAITGNTIADNIDYGIWLNGTTNATVTGNNISNSKSGGDNCAILLATGNANTLISDNNMFDDQGVATMTSGISGTVGSGAVIRNNTSNAAVSFPYNLTSASDSLMGPAPFIPLLSADRGDSSPSIAWGVDSPIQLFATNLTTNRTVTLQTRIAGNGSVFRIVRTGLGSFTLNVGGLKTIPSATAAFVEVTFNGTAWVLTGYGAL